MLTDPDWEGGSIRATVALTSALIATPNVAFGEGAKMKDWLERGRREDISKGAIIGRLVVQGSA